MFLGEVLSFGEFSLLPAERLLKKSGVTVSLGSRAFDILLALASRAGEPVEKKTLMAEAWPDVTVDEGSLRFQMAGLRKALGDGEAGARYVATLPGRGYCFVAEIARAGGPSDASASPVSTASFHSDLDPVSAPLASLLPNRLGRMIGRSEEAEEIATRLLARRFVTIVGPGGAGKTTVAIGIAHDLLDTFGGAVCFVDLAALRDPALVAAAVASCLGLPVQSDDPTANLIAYLRGRRTCIVIDNCEHVIDSVAAVAAALFAAAPQSHILATSREALRVEGEVVHRLAALTIPSDPDGETAASILNFTAPQLFVERAAARGVAFNLSDADARLVADICRKLDGVPLAIELAAGWVDAYGLSQIAGLLDERLSLLWRGRRNAGPRHQTLQATLDWSYDLLSRLEQTVLCRLAVFVGPFTLGAARAVAPDAQDDEAAVALAVAGLVAKSLVATDQVEGELHYRLLDTTRAYAFEKLLAADGVADVADRHAAYYRRWLEAISDSPAELLSKPQRAVRAAQLGNVRAALEWAFGAYGEKRSAVALAAVATAFLLEMSLLTEVQRWSSLGLAALDESSCGGEHEMKLRAAFGLSLMFARGNSEEARASFARGLEIAQDLGDGLSQLRLLARLQLFYERIGDFRGAMAYAQRAMLVARTIDDPEAVAAAHSLLGACYQLIGAQDKSRVELEAALRAPNTSDRISPTYFGFDHRIRAKVGLARTLWLQGRPRQAVRAAHDAVAEAANAEHAVTVCITLIWAVSVLLWNSDFESADDYLDRFIGLAEAHSLKPYLVIGRGVKGELDIRRGETERGVSAVQACLEALRAAHYEMVTSSFNTVLAEGLAAAGRDREAMDLIEAAIREVEHRGDLYCLPELLRIRAMIHVSGVRKNPELAEADLLSALDLSRRQSAPAWELRASVDLARLWTEHGQHDRSRALLEPLLEHFREDLDAPDARAARALLRTFTGASAS